MREILLILFQSHRWGGILASDRWKLKYFWTALGFILEGTSIPLLMFNHGAIKSKSSRLNSLWFVSPSCQSGGQEPMRRIHSLHLRLRGPTRSFVCAQTPRFNTNTHSQTYKFIQSSMNVCTQTHTHTLCTHTHTRTPPNLTMVSHSRPAINQWAGSCLPVRLNKSICEDLLSSINHLDSLKNTFPL